MYNGTITLVRGASGAGKTTFADFMLNRDGEKTVLSTDMYFEKPDGSYDFDFTKLQEAHSWCQEEVKQAMIRGDVDIVVANTFTREWEMRHYIELARRFNYQLFSIIVENRHGSENVHNVPDEVVEKQKSRFEVKL